MNTMDWLKLFIELGTLVVTALAFFFKMRADIRILSGDIKNTNARLETLNQLLGPFGQAMTAIAVQESRLARMDRDIDDLRHGRGFVQRSINGEYTNAGPVK